MAGNALLPYANKLKAISDEAYEAVIGTGGDHAGNLALGASQTIGQYLLPQLVAAFSGKTRALQSPQPAAIRMKCSQPSLPGEFS